MLKIENTNLKRAGTSTSMRKIIGALAGAIACWPLLILVVIIGSSQVASVDTDRSGAHTADCTNNLFIKLDDPSLSAVEVSKILEEAGENCPDKIGKVIVAQLLKYKDTSCKLESVARREVELLDPNDIACNGKINQGVLKFFEDYLLKRKEACALELAVKLDEALAKFSKSEKKLLKSLCPKSRNYNCLSDEEIIKSARRVSIMYNIFPFNREYRSSLACTRLIMELSSFMSDKVMKFAHPIDDKHTKLWFNITNECKDFVHYRCNVVEKKFELLIYPLLRDWRDGDDGYWEQVRKNGFLKKQYGQCVEYTEFMQEAGYSIFGS